ncbi:unnamed protein product [Malus baccata var. baccata]
MDMKILLCYTLRFLLCCTFIACISTASHTISPGQSLSGEQTITSPSGKFELGFFTPAITSPSGKFELGSFAPGIPQNYYVGIWYKSLPNRTVVWVANRKQPVCEPHFSVLQLVENGNLTLSGPSKVAIWSTNSRSKVFNSSVARLLDNGNFVITDAFNSSVVKWQSFDHPTDTWLPGAKLGYNNRTRRKLVLTSWRNPKTPAPGPFSSEIDEIPVNLSSYPDTFTRGRLEINGQLKFYAWDQGFTEWTLISAEPSDQCAVDSSCGAFSICNQRSFPRCGCLEGFEPRVRESWMLEDFSDGCVRKIPFHYSPRDSFLAITDVGIGYTKNYEQIINALQALIAILAVMLPSMDLRSEYVVFVSCMNVICSRVICQYLSGSQTITSPGGTFELGSFTPGESRNYYIDICSGAAKLLDNGNFVITDASDSSVVIGQSFDHLTDTWLPGAELGYNLRTKGKRVLTSRRNLQYPAPRLMVSKFSDFL